MSYSFLDFLTLLGAIGLFLYGMKVMSEGLQKAAGDRLRNVLSAMTRNRFTGVLTGFFITALIQSSSASTVMVVSFVNAGLMSLAQSMAVIFGANVGTTFTAWIISLFGFKIDTSMYILPILAIAVPLLFTHKSRTKSIGEFLIGFSFLFMGLNLISHYVPDLQSNPDMFASLERYASMGFRSVLLFLLVGAVITMIIQSSAATFAIVLVMCTKGWISFDLACAMVLGSNIGTTITPILASMSGNVAAKRTALGHLLFNLLGTFWTLCIFYPFVELNEWLTNLMGEGNPEQLFGYVNDLQSSNPAVYDKLFDGTLSDSNNIIKAIARMQMSVSFGLSVFHTVFNFINLMIMIWFTKLYVKIVERIISTRHKEDEEFQLKFISGGLLNASELNLAQAEKEIVVFAERVDRMIDMSQTLVLSKENSEEFDKLYSRIEKYEEIANRMEIEIARYLNRCAEGRLSNNGKLRITAMLSMVSDIESIADCCFGIAKTLIRKQESHVKFNDEIYENINRMYVYVKEAIKNMLVLIRNLDNIYEPYLIKSYNKEREINNLRNQLRVSNIENINNNHYEYQSGIYYMDIIADLEKTGDYIINVVDTLKDRFRKQRK